MAEGPITAGVVAGMRMVALQEQLKSSRAERMEWELTKNYREAMRNLELNRLNADLTTQLTTNALRQTQLEQAESELTEQKATTGSRVKTAKIGVKQAQLGLGKTTAETAQTQALTAESGTRAQGNVIENAIRGQALARTLGEGAGRAGMVPVGAGLSEMAAVMMTEAGVRFSEGDPTHQLWQQRIQQGAIAASTELTDNTKKNLMNRVFAFQQNVVALAEPILRSSNPEAGLAELDTNPEFTSQPTLTSAVKAYVKAKVRPQVEVTTEARTSIRDLMAPGEAERDKELNEFLSAAELELDESKTDKQKAEAQRKIDNFQRRIEALHKKVNDKVRGAQSSTRTSGIPTITTQAEFDALPSGSEYIDASNGKKYRKP